MYSCTCISANYSQYEIILARMVLIYTMYLRNGAA